MPTTYNVYARYIGYVIYVNIMYNMCLIMSHIHMCVYMEILCKLLSTIQISKVLLISQ